MEMDVYLRARPILTKSMVVNWSAKSSLPYANTVMRPRRPAALQHRLPSCNTEVIACDRYDRVPQC